MAITKIQTGGIPDASVTHAKLHGTMDLTGKTVTLPSIDMGSNNITTTGKVIFSNIYAQVADLPSASTYHGMFAHVHATGKAYYAHAGAWIVLANDADKLNLSGGTMTGTLGVSTAANNYVTVTSTNNNTRAGYLSSSKKSDGTVVKTWIRSEEGGIGSIFTETNHNLGFATNNAAPQMTLTTGGSLGIGIISPQRQLVLYSPTASGQANIQFQNSTTGAAAADGFGVGMDAAEKGFIWNYESNDTYIGGATGGTSLTVAGSNGNVGIGTTAPGYPLQVNGNVDILNVKGSSGNAFVRFTDGDATADFSIGADDGSGAGAGAFILYDRSNSAYRLVVNSSGNVGIGNSSPAEKLVLGSTSDANTRLQFLSTTSGGNTIHFGDGASANAYRGYIHYSHASDSLAIATAGTEALKIDIYGNIMGVNRGFIVSSSSQTGTFYNSGDGAGLYKQASYSNCGTHMEIANNAAHGWSNIYLHKTWSSGQDTRMLQFGVNAAVVGSITVSTSSTTYATSSDYRLKENVVGLTDASARVNQLNPSRFNFIADDTNTLVDGFLAHEVADVVPEAITGTKDAMKDEEYEVTPAVLDDDGNVTTEAVIGTRSVPDYQGIDQSKLVPLLTAALQEALAEIASLKTRIEALE